MRDDDILTTSCPPQICRLLGGTLEVICDSIIEGNLPDIINGLVNDNLNPTEICQAISPKPDTTANPTTAAPAL